MGLIINIDTATEKAFVNIAKDGKVLGQKENIAQKDHAAFLQPAIKALVQDIHINLNELEAVAVSSGPGSYTGLRVGMASAKGLCYALQKPLITINSLEISATTAKTEIVEPGTSNILFCPMIDARRMEIFTALYNYEMEVLIPAHALILEENSFAEKLAGNIIYFSGSGATKWNTLCRHRNARFVITANTGGTMAALSYKQLCNKQFSELITAVPTYIKDFHSGSK